MKINLDAGILDYVEYTQLIIGFALGIIVAFTAWKTGALSRSGALAAALTGGLLFGLGGLSWAVLLLVFFTSSSGLSRAFSHHKTTLNEKFSKGSRRDWGQVLANGGLGTLLVIIHAVTAPDFAWPWIAYAGALAAVNADTWATELGVLSKLPPRLITSGQPVERGTSGGISLTGTLASTGGAALIGLFTPLGLPASRLLGTVILITLAGLAGSLFDSWLGATVQAIYHCPICDKETERYPTHTCGSPTLHVRGWSWLNNDMVNIAASLVGAVFAAGSWFFFF